MDRHSPQMGKKEKSEKDKSETPQNSSDEKTTTHRRISRSSSISKSNSIEIYASNNTDFEEEEEANHEEQEEKIVISKILAHKTDKDGHIEFFVKLHNKSFRECQWISEDMIDKKKSLSYYHYWKKHSDAPPEEPYFPPSYVIPEKIIGQRVYHEKKQYLVKWTDLSYDNLTWEDEDKFDFPQLISTFQASQRMPSLDDMFIPPHPNPKEFRPLTHHSNSKSGFSIRQYQLSGLNFLINSWFNKRNAILADEMGLGKTVQCILFLNYLYSVQKIRGPFLITVPLSTIPHWEREIKEWSDFSVINFTGNTNKRRVIEKYEMFYPNTSIVRFTIILTTYEYIMKEEELLSNIKWRCIVIDEAHRIKNHESKLFNTLHSYTSDFKLLMTGTPLQNNTDELWSLLNFLDPEAFEDLHKFQKSFGELSDTDQIIELQSILKPLMLRRLKSDVEKSILPLEEIIIECPMTSYQKAYYKSIFHKNMDYLSRGAHSGNTSSLRNISMELRKVCNHPFLIKGAEKQITIEQKERLHIESDDQIPDNFEFDMLVRTAGKMILLNKLLAKLKQDNHRVLLFSQMTTMLDIIQDYLDLQEYKYERIDGSVKSNQRQVAIDKFNAPNSEDFIFLLCTRSGGVGINLASADTVIIFDSDFNPQNDIQATARCHRIGQKKEVKMYRFITEKSYERKMFDRASIKLGLDHAVLESSKDSGNNLFDIEKLLRLGAYYAFEEDDDNKAAETFGEEDIEAVISRSTRIQHASVVGGEGSTFSTAHFEISEDESQINLTDPDFWKKYTPVVQEENDLEGSSIAERYRLIRARSSSEDLKEEKKSSDKNKVKEKPKTKQEKKWSHKSFQSLLNGLLRFGWGRWHTIIEMGHLSHPMPDVINVSHIILKWLLDSVTDEFPVILSIYHQCTERDKNDPAALKFQTSFNRQYKSIFGSTVTNGANWKAARLDMLYFIDTIVKSATTPPDDIPIPSVTVAKPTEWWTNEDDRKLLFYTWKYGFSNYNQNLEFSVPFGDDNPFPPISKLTARLRSIMTNLKTIYARFKLQKQEDLSFSCDVLREAIDAWSKREHRSIIRTLLHYGFPDDISKFKEKAELTGKTDDKVRQYVNLISDYCKATNEGEPTEKFVLEEQIYPKTGRKILNRIELFKLIRENVENPQYAENKELLQYLSENGTIDISESEWIKSHFQPEEATENAIMTKVKNLFFKKEKKKVEKQINFSLRSFSRNRTSFDNASERKTYITPPHFEMDEDGNFKFPIQVSTKVKILSLGKIIYDNPNYFNNRYIFPVGFVMEREFFSITDPNSYSSYRGSIKEGEDGPIFCVESLDGSNAKFEASKPSNPWLAISQAIEDSKKKNGIHAKEKVTISGPVAFGLTLPFVTYLIQKLPNAKKCEGYTFKRYYIRGIDPSEDEISDEKEYEYEYVEEEEEEEEAEFEEEENGEKEPLTLHPKQIEFNFGLIVDQLRKANFPASKSISIPMSQLMQPDLIDLPIRKTRNPIKSAIIQLSRSIAKKT